MPLLSTFIASDLLNEAANEAMATLTNLTDIACKVNLVAVAFVESADIDESTIPATTNFAEKTASGATIELDETGRLVVVFTDPTGGWDFASISTGFPITIHGYRVDGDGGDFMGCKQITPVTITATGQHVILGSIVLRPEKVMFNLPGDPS